MANVFRVSENTAQAIGSWQEHPQGEGGAASTSRQLMSVHYSDQRALASAEAKREVLTRFFHLVQSSGKLSLPSGSSQPWQLITLTWDQLASLGHQQQHQPSPSSSPPITIPHASISSAPSAARSPEGKRKKKKDGKKKKEKHAKKDRGDEHRDRKRAHHP